MNAKKAYIYTDRPLLNAFDWLNKAIGKDEIRFPLMNLRVTPERVIATDGKRMHIWKTELGIPDGVYSLIIRRTRIYDFEEGDCEYQEPYLVAEKAILIESDSGYPKWEQVMPKHEKEFKFPTFKESQSGSILLKTGMLFDVDYIKDAIGFSVSNLSLKYGEPKEAISLEYADRQAVIMPIRQEEEGK